MRLRVLSPFCIQQAIRSVTVVLTWSEVLQRNVEVEERLSISPY